jgi:hypothetical protein
MDGLKFSWREWLPWRPWRIAATVDAADDVPHRLPPKCAVLVGSRTTPKWLAFDCPCRSGHRIMISLDGQHSPHWRVTADTRLTLHPSVDAWRARVRCHYIIRDGRTHWVRHEEPR